MVFSVNQPAYIKQPVRFNNYI